MLFSLICLVCYNQPLKKEHPFKMSTTTYYCPSCKEGFLKDEIWKFQDFYEKHVKQCGRCELSTKELYTKFASYNPELPFFYDFNPYCFLCVKDRLKLEFNCCCNFFGTEVCRFAFERDLNDITKEFNSVHI